MGFNSAFKGLRLRYFRFSFTHGYLMYILPDDDPVKIETRRSLSFYDK